MAKVKKHSLFPIAYDEISLVDEGAAGSAHVLIAKRKTVAASPMKTPSANPATGLNEKKKNTGRSQENPCSTKTNSTGKKDGKSTRSKNFDESKHPRDEKGQMAPTSSESKEKYGKGGTTKAKLDAACKKKKKSGNGKGVATASPAPIKSPPLKNNIKRKKIKNKSGSFTDTSVSKSSVSTWNNKILVTEFLEGKM